MGKNSRNMNMNTNTGKHSYFWKNATSIQKQNQISRFNNNTSTKTKHTVLLIGDSHIRGWAERIGSYLGNSFNVSSIIKPNADIYGITSPSHLSIDKLTKQDVIILYGGTRDISRNESESGIVNLKKFFAKVR
jgi:hypothetical protein